MISIVSTPAVPEAPFAAKPSEASSAAFPAAVSVTVNESSPTNVALATSDADIEISESAGDVVVSVASTSQLNLSQFKLPMREPPFATPNES